MGGKETERVAITNGDDFAPIEVSVVESTDEPWVYGIVGLNPDGTTI